VSRWMIHEGVAPGEEISWRPRYLLSSAEKSSYGIRSGGVPARLPAGMRVGAVAGRLLDSEFVEQLCLLLPVLPETSLVEVHRH